MSSLFSKIRTLISANLHDLADRALRRNDLAVYDEYIRQATKEVEEFKQIIQPLYGQVRETKRRREALAEEAAKMDIAIDAFLRQGKKTEAMVTQRQLNSALELVRTYDASLTRQVAALEKMDDIKVKLEGRLALARQEREELGYLLELAKAKEVSAQAMRSLDDLMGQGDTDVARAAENIRRRLDHADASWEVQTSRLDSQLDTAVHDLEVEAELAARMERLGL